MFGTDEEEDFIPASGSKLATLFGKASEEEGNASLTYVAPKQPKRNRLEPQGLAVKSSAQQPKLSLIIVKAVQTFKLEDGNYNSQGKLGAAVLGNITTKVFQLLLYKNKQQHVTSAKITDKFQFTVQPNKFASFYDDQRQNWSIMFDTEQDEIEFSKQICLVRANAYGDEGEQPFYVQDLKLGEGLVAEISDLLEVRYTTSPLSGCTLGQEIETNVDADRPQRVKIRKGVWEEALIGSSKGCKKLIVLAPELFGPWKPMAPPNVRLAVEVEVGRIKSNRRSRDNTPPINIMQGDSSESNMDSSADDTSIKARGASISEALTNSPKTHKASIISRMARMGQATLPLKGAVACNPSDSEETEEDCSGSSHVVKPVAKSRSVILKPRSTSQECTSSAPSTGTAPSSKQHVTVLQAIPTPGPGSAAWQHQQPAQQILHNGMAFTIPPQYSQFSTMMTQPSVGSHQLFPAPTATVATPTSLSSSDAHLGIILSENRAQNMEVRMGVSKVIDKVDQVMVKLDNLSQPRLSSSVGALEPMVLLASVQKLVRDNELLQTELCDKRVRLEQQNDKMYQLLNSNHKTFWFRYLEQQELQQQDQPLQAMIISLQQEKVKLTVDLTDALAKASSFQSQASNFEKAGNELSEEVSKVTAELHRQQAELESNKQTILEQETSLHNLEDKLHASTEQQQLLESTIEDLKAAKLALDNELADVNQKIESQKLEASEQMSALVASHQEQLENIHSQLKVQNQLTSLESDEVKHLKDSLARQEETYKEIVEKMDQDQEHLRNKLHKLEDQLKSDETTKQTDPTTVVEDVKKVMNVMFRLLKTEFELGRSYEGSDIIQTLLSTIKDVTLQYVKMKSTSGKQSSLKNRSAPQTQESNKELPVHMSNSLEASVSPDGACLMPNSNHLVQTSSNVSSCTNEVRPMESEVQLQSVVLHEGMQSTDAESRFTERNKSPVNQVTHLLQSAKVSNEFNDLVSDEKTESLVQEMSESNQGSSESDEKRQYTNLSSEKINNTGSIECKDHATETEPELIQATHHSRESSLERGWRPQPPPPPLFDDEDDDDDWLS